MTSQPQHDAFECPLCGKPSHCQLCGAAPHKGPCWCTTVRIPDGLLARVPLELRNRACICQACVTAFWQEQSDTQPQAFRRGDFYFDQNGLMVFTVAYHLRRGHCCGSGCRHCPYQSKE